jgi:hypothetical protein
MAIVTSTHLDPAAPGKDVAKQWAATKHDSLRALTR